jgi:hypothetical protein
VQGVILGSLDMAIRAAAAEGNKHLPAGEPRLFRLGSTTLYAQCSGATGTSSSKLLLASDDAARAAAVDLISGLQSGAGLPALAEKVPEVTLIMSVSSVP